MPGRGGIQHIGLKHGVEGNAAYGYALGRVAADGTVRENVHVEFGVLADLELGRVFQ